METLSRFLDLPSRSFFLFGPRGTGKSTWLRHQLPGGLFLDLLRPELYRELSSRPERLRDRVLATSQGSDIIIDEVQRIPELLNVVHELMEAGGSRRYVLTGSSARKLRRGGVDLLAGRAVERSLHPFMAAEWPGFDLVSALEHGLVPLVVAAPNPHDVLAAYASLYLEQEVQLEGWARDVGRFGRFLEAISFSHGAVLNVANVARECQVERKTVAGFVEVLEDLLLCVRLPVFTRRAQRQTTSHPKLYLFDAGVFRSLRPRGPLDRPEEVTGAALEGLVAQHLRAWTAYSTRRAELSFWRTRGGSEVDFVVYGEAGFWAIEVQNTATIRARDLRSLRTFRVDFPECEPMLLHRGQDRLHIDDIWCVPVEEFLRELRPDRGLTAYLP